MTTMRYTQRIPQVRMPGMWGRMIADYRVWQERQALAALTDDQLSDTGITRLEADAEMYRGFFDTDLR
ncbi:MAG: hypothetical protein RIC16_07200 [Rhodospirillales bacterium]